jgi:hypothetical protein
MVASTAVPPSAGHSTTCTSTARRGSCSVTTCAPQQEAVSQSVATPPPAHARGRYTRRLRARIRDCAQRARPARRADRREGQDTGTGTAPPSLQPISTSSTCPGPSHPFPAPPFPTFLPSPPCHTPPALPDSGLPAHLHVNVRHVYGAARGLGGAREGGARVAHQPLHQRVSVHVARRRRTAVAAAGCPGQRLGAGARGARVALRREGGTGAHEGARSGAAEERRGAYRMGGAAGGIGRAAGRGAWGRAGVAEGAGRTELGVAVSGTVAEMLTR